MKKYLIAFIIFLIVYGMFLAGVLTNDLIQERDGLIEGLKNCQEINYGVEK